MSEVLIALCTFPDADQARQIGTVLVEKQLAACVNLLPGVASIYRWEGKIEEAGETLALFKTTQPAWVAFEKELTELHPYEVPEILALKPEAVAEAYAAWVRLEVCER
ncbi:MAG TPA: divalent-cation tolerance protein CutA [Luteolibacter sp.]